MPRKRRSASINKKNTTKEATTRPSQKRKTETMKGAAPTTQAKKAKRKDKKTTAKVKELDPVQVKSKLKERILSIPESEQNTIKLKWTSKSIAKSDEQAVVDKIVVKGCYGPIDEQQRSQIEDHIKSTQINLFQAITLRSASLTQKAMFRHATLQKQAKTVYSQYRKGCTVLDLSKKFDQPPMNVLRIIFSEMKMGKGAIKKALRNPKKLQKREREEVLSAEGADIVSMVNMKEVHKNSEDFEDVLSAWLKQKGIRFVRQKELEKEQEKEFGKCILTPDFLLLDQVYINGSPCHWIDCKAYYGANLSFSVKKTKKQMSRYIDHWGPGAITYLQGFSEAIDIKDCAILSAYDILDKKTLSRLEEAQCEAINTVPKEKLSNSAK